MILKIFNTDLGYFTIIFQDDEHNYITQTHPIKTHDEALEIAMKIRDSAKNITISPSLCPD